MKFNKETLRNILYGEESDFIIIKDEIVDNTRWSIVHDLVFRQISTDKYYMTDYSVGATEEQDERPFQYAAEEIECDEVEPREKMVVTYVKVTK